MSQKPLTLDGVELVRDLLAFPDRDDPNWILEQVREGLQVRPGRKPDPIADLAVWRAGFDAIGGVFGAIGRELFAVDPRVIGIDLDFMDCDGVPFVWMELAAQEEGDEPQQVILSEYDAPEEAAGLTGELERIAQELLHDNLRAARISVSRDELGVK